MKKVLPALILTSFLGVLLVPAMASAVVDTLKVPESTKVTDIESLIKLLNTLVTYVFAFVLAVAGILIIWAGFSFMTAAGDPTKMKGARDRLTYALVGLAIALGVKGLMMIIGNLLGVSVPIGF